MHSINGMLTAHTISIPPVQRRYRVVTDEDSSCRLVASKPSVPGSVSLRVSRFPTSPEALDACLDLLIADFDHDFSTALGAFEICYRSWSDGRPGVRPRSRAARQHAERVGNDLFQLIRGYATAYLTMTSLARERGLTLKSHAVPLWLQSGIADVQSGASSWLSLEELTNQRLHFAGKVLQTIEPRTADGR